MRIITYNVNGIRSAVKKGFYEWLATDPADIVCLQEVKAQRSDIDIASIETMGYHTQWFCAQKKGYSGVGILSKIKPDNVVEGCQIEQSDLEGRVIRADFGDITIINAYFPSGTMGDVRQAYKYVWLDEFLDWLLELRKTRSQLIVCGDYNIAHREIDLHSPKTNKKTTGFLPEERAWFDKFLANGFVDGLREITQEPAQYTWWNQLRPSIREENKGWRIDYINVTENLRHRIKDAKVLPHIKHSDHGPMYLELE
ncbi:exodeoxyribonuclease III [Aridibaculum aurantiacum]|uniref:exodeoxyribonuclease III n=1 Tax=Aridibaculum aurantiacum TaxID=2810307 RepID=UPI001A965C4C|nr:exodeoxyribonuclease III [Aridibaculum aurantiacum]